ncbi:hypothetical protein TWF506_000095 [Arthrobotrys conoides]|uniref:Uncharacterized protein n=1 Tax=Arthrobotrys conoides TaxID=74498 RepID=A0AAN8P7Q2_9PEZI
MKTTFTLAFLAALVAAMPQADSLLKRESPRNDPIPAPGANAVGCSVYESCSDGQVCLGERRIFENKDKGYCVEKYIDCTVSSDKDNLGGDCPKGKEYICVPRANQLACKNCGLCLEKDKYDKTGGLQPYICKDKEPKLCFEDEKEPGSQSVCLTSEFWKKEDSCPEYLKQAMKYCEGGADGTCDSGLTCKRLCPDYDLGCVDTPGKGFCIPDRYLKSVVYGPVPKPGPKPVPSGVSCKPNDPPATQSSCTPKTLKVTVTVTSVTRMKPVVRVKTVISRVTVTKYKYSNKKNGY